VAVGNDVDDAPDVLVGLAAHFLAENRFRLPGAEDGQEGRGSGLRRGGGLQSGRLGLELIAGRGRGKYSRQDDRGGSGAEVTHFGTPESVPGPTSKNFRTGHIVPARMGARSYFFAIA